MLTLALIDHLREAGTELLAWALLVSPWTGLTMSGASLELKDLVDPLIHKSYLSELASAYLDGAVVGWDPRVSPAYADLRGFSPSLTQIDRLKHFSLMP